MNWNEKIEPAGWKCVCGGCYLERSFFRMGTTLKTRTLCSEVFSYYPPKYVWLKDITNPRLMWKKSWIVFKVVCAISSIIKLNYLALKTLFPYNRLIFNHADRPLLSKWTSLVQNMIAVLIMAFTCIFLSFLGMTLVLYFKNSVKRSKNWNTTFTHLCKWNHLPLTF
jgi:hypothetical protein